MTRTRATRRRPMSLVYANDHESSTQNTEGKFV